MKQISKILLLTMLLTLCITSTCFAYTDSELEEIDAALQTTLSNINDNSRAYMGKPYIIFNYPNDGAKYKWRIYFYDTEVTGSLLNDGSTLRINPAFIARTYIGYDSGKWTVEIFQFDKNVQAYRDVSISDIVTSTFIVKDTDGNQIYPVPQEPEIPDIPDTLLFPETDYTYWEGLIHNANDITYAIMLVSNDPFTADDFLLSASGDKIRFSASSDKDIQYFVRVYTLNNEDKSWTFNSGSSYNGKTMSHVSNVGGIVMTTKNIVNEDGSIFFPLTPTVQLDQLGAKILKAMAVITIVAVSLLALWISLIVLLKVLNRFLR